MKSHDLYKKGWHPSSEDPGRWTDPAGHRSSHKLCTGAIFRGGCKLLLILHCLNIYLIFITVDVKVCVHNEHCAIILCLFHHQ